LTPKDCFGKRYLKYNKQRPSSGRLFHFKWNLNKQITIFARFQLESISIGFDSNAQFANLHQLHADAE